MAPACLLSVVIPTYNRRDLVLRAVQSVLDQRTTADLEIVVADDGSTDGTVGALADRFGSEHRVRCLSLARGHACAARNRGFEAARGDLVCFLDSDDFWLPGFVDDVLAVFARHPAIGFVSVDGSTLATPRHPPTARIVAGLSPGWSHAAFRSVRFDAEELALSRDRRAPLLTGDFFPAIINGDLFYLSGLVIRREAVLRAGPFNERLRYFNDWEFFARLCLATPGAYLGADGFRRDTGRDDQISRRRPVTALARRHLFILRALLRRDDARIHYYRLQAALTDAQYRMGRCLRSSTHKAWARRYLLRSLRSRHKILRSMALLSGWR